MIMNNIPAQSGTENEIYTLTLWYDKGLTICFTSENGIELHTGMNPLEYGEYKIRPGILVILQPSKNPISVSGAAQRLGVMYDNIEVYQVQGGVLIQ